MKLPNERKWADRAGLVEQMIHRLRSLAAGDATREEVESWALALDGKAFAGYGDANSILGCICSLTQVWGEGPLIRDLDLREYLRALDEGSGFVGADGPMAGVRRPIEWFEERYQRSATRWDFDGLGFHSYLNFASPATGRAFVACRKLEGPTRIGTQILRRASDNPEHAMTDMLRTLTLSADDVIWAETDGES